MSTTEMQRELPVLIAETSTLNISKEYKLTGHGTRRTKYGSIILEDYQSVLISAVQNITFDEFMIPSSLFADIHVEADIISSTVAPQKFASAQNVASLYNIILDNVAIFDVQNNTFSDGLPENAYQGPSGIPAIFKTSTFGSSYTTYPLTYQEYVKQVPIVISGTSTLQVSKEYKVSRHAKTLQRWNEVLLSEFSSAPISSWSSSPASFISRILCASSTMKSEPLNAFFRRVTSKSVCFSCESVRGTSLRISRTRLRNAT
jgi:hypothetical protein